jgi:tRNA (guanine37-N1)-methyltransferase
MLSQWAAMRIDVVTLFPEMITGAVQYSMVKRAQESGALAVGVRDPREFTTDRHRTVDDTPFGGGAGMLMKVEPVMEAIEACERQAEQKAYVVLTEPQGKLLTQETVRRLAGEPYLILLCGHYEGIDHRIAEHVAHERLSIGDFVLSGGELAALVIIDAVARLQQGVLGSEESLTQDSFEDGLLGFPQYTRPEEYHGWRVPEVLLSGHHGAIKRWRRARQLLQTRAERPDLFARAPITESDLRILADALRGEVDESG